MSEKYNYKTLCVIQSPMLLNLLETAKLALVKNDYNFAAEIELAQRQHRDPSIVVRRALRDFLHHIHQVTNDQWGRYIRLYQNRGHFDQPKQFHLRILDDGRDQLDQIYAYIVENPSVFNGVWNENVSPILLGLRINNAALVICALAWETERLSERGIETDE